MKKLQDFLLLLVFLLMGYSTGLRAEDTDIYVDNADTAGVPNVLFVMDNGANFSANAQVGCAFYSGTSEVPSLGNDTGAGIEQCALVDAISSLPNNSVNIGLLVSNANNFASDVRALADVSYHELCTTAAGGCLLRKLTRMDAAGKASLISFIKSWTSSGSTSATAFNIKVNTALPGTMMQEAWAYYSGKIGMSGTSYPDSVLATGCQKNFVIYIANGEKTPASENPSPLTDTYAMTSAQVGATTAQKVKISETVTFNPAACGSTTMAPGTNASNWSENWADEWARLMYQKDGGAGDAEGMQSITTYTIGVVNNATCTADYPALLTTMAKYGGGKYFKTSTVAEVTKALQTILNEVQAVNSVFSSASLPVSVNAEGSYLNQIYLGMFRPDPSGNPRWMGNLKQYQIVKNGSGNLVLGDSVGEAAISSAGTGFISPNAVSFWSNKNVATAPDNAGGFWLNDMKGVPANAFDSPDGEVVEKGGVGQQLRLENLTADFGATAGDSTNPRRLYTYCPNGSSCVAALTDAANQLSIANAGVSTSAFGSSTTVPINSIIRTGTTALVTTNGNHGFTTGTSVTVSNVNQADYNVTQTVTVNSSTTFTITGLPDYPTTPSAGTYTIATVGGAPVSITSITRNTSATGGANTQTATVTTSTPHGFTGASTIAISGASPSAFNFSGTPSSVPSATVFTFPVSIEPATPPVNTYQATISPSAYPSKAVNLSKFDTNVIGVATTNAAAHGFWVGQSVTISGAVVDSAKYNGTFTIATVPSPSTFTVSASGLGNTLATTGSVVPAATPKTVSLSRVATTSSATVTATGATASFFGNAVGLTRVINITKSSGSATNEAAYVQSNVTMTCIDATCTSFTYPITTSPSTTATGTITVALSGAASADIPAASITRTSGGATATATVTGLTPDTFADGDRVTIGASGSALSTESAYVGTWTIACTGTCTSFTFGPVALTPTTPATGASMQAFSGASPPDKDTVVKWIRGADNYGDEKGPGGSVTVRPSIHGDVLHSRPLVINYGDGRGIVVFYGANDGVFRAVNGNKTTAIDSVPAGGELWGLVLPEHFGDINRLRLNSPELKFPSTTLATAQPKDYFVDGATGAYQQLTTSGTIDKAYIYLTMRRGGRFIYALNVSTPTLPTVKWKIDSTTAGFGELGQTWSRPRTTLLQRDVSQTTPTPVLVFGAGYDPAEDSEPPTTGTMGRGIYIVNADSGALIWSANSTCANSATCRNVPGMTYAIPADVTFVDRDLNGYTDKLYFADLGGNVWRADVGAANSSDWTVTKLAALGCAAGTCSSGTTPRKFFFPPAVLTVKPAGATGSFDAISVVSGDREHPLKNTATGSSYNVNDRFFMLMDRGTTVNGTATSGMTPATLFNATTTAYDGSLDGFYINFATGEKGVNAPLALSGYVFFGTNRPIDRSATCSANLGEAKAYAVSPFLGTQTSSVFAGGGLPPSPVSGFITDGGVTEKFCIGCGISELPSSDPGNGGGAGPGGGDCGSTIGPCVPPAIIPKQMRRTYWYKK